MTRFYLGIDGGASSAKWCVVDESGAKISEGIAGPIDGHIYRSDSKKRLAEFLEELKAIVPSELAGIYLGLTGAPEEPEKQGPLLNEINNHFPKVACRIENDVYLGYRAALGNRNGIFLYAGTGSILIYLDRSGKLKRIGGWGYLLGDEGSGYWIGREAIRSALFDIESGSASSINDLIYRRAGGSSWDAIKGFVYSADRSEIAAIAKDVLELAESGDERARELVEAAGSELAALIERGFLSLGDSQVPVIFSGGISKSGGDIKRAIERELGREIEIFNGDTSFTAAQLARSL